MKTKLIIPFLAITLLFSNSIFSNSVSNTDPDKDRVIVYVLKNILSRYHYVQKDLNDDFSEHVYNTFIDGLDPNKRYFTQEDLKEFSKYKYQIDNQLKDTKIDFYKLVYNRFLEKLSTAKNNYRTLLLEPFNYKKDEVIDVDYDKIPFAKNENELVNYWRKQLKLSILSRIEDAQDQQKEKAKKDKTFKKKSFTELEKEARKEVLKT